MSAFFESLAQSWVQWTDVIWLRHLALIGAGMILLVLLRNYEPGVRRVITLILAVALCLPPLLTFETTVPAAATVTTLDAVTIAASLKSAVSEAVAQYFAQNVLFTIWLLGAVILAALTVVGSVPHYHMALKATPISGGLRPDDMPRRTRIGTHAAAKVPFVVAWFGGARIVVPESWYNWTENERSAVIAHECAHVKHGDHLWVLLFSALRVVFWWNPLVWMLTRAYHHSAEMCSDDRARRDVKLSANDYAQVLLNFAKKSSPRLGTAVTFVQQPSLIKQRILHQIQPSKELVMRNLVIAALCLAITPFLFNTENVPAGTTLQAGEDSKKVAVLQKQDQIEVGKDVRLRSEAHMKGGAASLANTLHYPKECYAVGAEARIMLELVVEADGSLSNITYSAKNSQMLNGPKDTEQMRLFANAAIEAVSQVNFEPAVSHTQNAKVRSKVVLPITFKMPADKNMKSLKTHPIEK